MNYSPKAGMVACAMLRHLPQRRPLLGVEIGVYKGELSEALFRSYPHLTLVMVDAWSEANPNPRYFDSGDAHARITQRAHDEAYAECLANVMPYRHRALVLRAHSLDVALICPNAAFDFVFIDADHSYEGCAQDISRWRDKVRAGGVICGHDYENQNYPQFGVKRAVDEAFGDKVVLDDFMTWFVQL